jgi:ribosomal protein L37AE/L43A
VHNDLLALFPDLLARHVPKLIIKGDQARGQCPIHHGDNPQAFSANLSKGVWQCHACGAKGGAVAFARAVGAPLPNRTNNAPLSPSHTVRQSLASAVEAEYRAWKLEKWTDISQQVLAAQSVVESLLACRRFALSDAEAETLGKTISAWYDDLAQLTDQMDRYTPNPKIDDADVQQEWLEMQ